MPWKNKRKPKRSQRPSEKKRRRRQIPLKRTPPRSRQRSERQPKTVGKHAIAVGETVAKNKMSTLGSVASALSICMYVSYIPQIIGNLSGHPGDWIQPSVAFVNCTLWVIYGLFRKKPEWPLVFANAPGIIFGLTAAITARM